MGTILRIVETSLSAKHIEEACRLNEVKVIELKETSIIAPSGRHYKGYVNITVEVEREEQLYYLGRTIEQIMREQ